MLKHAFLILFFAGCVSVSLAYELEPIYSDKELKILKREAEPTTLSIKFKAIPAKPGYITVLRCKAYFDYIKDAGWNSYLRFSLNSKKLGRFTRNGNDRLLKRGRNMLFKRREQTVKKSWWSGTGLTIFFTDKSKLPDKRLQNAREEECNYLLDISDLVKRKGENKLIIYNCFVIKPKSRNKALEKVNMHIEDFEIAYLKKEDAEKMRPNSNANIVKKDFAPPKSFKVFYTYPKNLVIKRAKQVNRTSIKFKAVPPKKGHIIALRYKGYLKTARPGGWNNYTGLELNKMPLGEFTREDEVRLLRRGSNMKTNLLNKRTGKKTRSWWPGGQLMTFFANGDDNAMDKRLLNAREEGYNYLLDITDLVNKVEYGADYRIEKAEDNILGFSNGFTSKIAKNAKALKNAHLHIENIQIGYIPVSEAQKMRPGDTGSGYIKNNSKLLIKKNQKNYTLHLYGNGGFDIVANGIKYMQDDSFSYAGKNNIEYSNLGNKASSLPQITQFENRIKIKFSNKIFNIERTIFLKENYLDIQDEISNKSNGPQGMKVVFKTFPDIPFSAKTFVNGMKARYVPDGAGGQNPSFFTKPSQGASLGVYVYEDLLRNQSSFLRTRKSFILEDAHLGFKAGASHKLGRRFYIMPDAGYFDFVNQVRRDYKLNMLMDGPFCFGSGPKFPKVKYYAMGGWFEWLHSYVSREEFKKQKQAIMAKTRKKEPNAKFLLRLESNLVLVDKTKLPNGHKLPKSGRDVKGVGTYGLVVTPEQNEILKNSPFSDSILRDASGMAIVDNLYPPEPYIDLMVHFAEGNYRLKNILEQIDYLLDEVGADGVYIDQFIPGCDGALTAPGRCSYDRWDGFTVDLDKKGRIKRKYYDYIIAGSSARAKIVKHVLAKNKVMFNNNHPVTMETNGLRSYSFVEMECNRAVISEFNRTNKPSIYRLEAIGQLSGSPLTLGACATHHTKNPKEYARIINRAVIVGLRHGILYAYYHCDITAKTSGGAGAIDNMYPITPVELGEGFIIGKERILSCISRKFVVKSKKQPECLLFNDYGLPHSRKIKAKKVKNGWEIDVKLRDWNEIAVIIL